MTQSPFSLILTACCFALLFLAPAFAQDETQEKITEQPLTTVSASQPNKSGEALDKADAEPNPAGSVASEPFQLPREQHPWARFQPGAWRDLQTVTEEFDEAGNVTTRNVTRQEEVLQAVADGKYVLQVRVTVDMGGKRIVGDWKTRVLHFETDDAGPLVDSSRLEDETLQLAGGDSVCQVWQLRYRHETRNMMDRVYYDPGRFPFVLKRETIVADSEPAEKKAEPADQIEQLMQVSSPAVPYLVGDQLLSCAFQRTLRRHAKGDTERLAFLNKDIPGGEVAVSTIDFNAQGHPVRSAFTTLSAYGKTPPEIKTAPKTAEPTEGASVLANEKS